MKELYKQDGTTILISYQTPVAVKTWRDDFVVTDKFFSKTTSEHINHWLQLHNVLEYRIEPQRIIQNLAEKDRTKRTNVSSESNIHDAAVNELYN